MQLILIGTSFQEFPKAINDIPDAFVHGLVKRIAQVAKNFYVRTIAEEKFFEDSDSAHVPLCLDVAKELKVNHIFCDSEKTQDGISGLSAERDLFSANQRQIEWLSRIKKAEFPVLVVCGANHIDGFARKCRSETIKVMLLDRNWRP